MSKRVNNKKGNRAKRGLAYNHRTRVRAGSHLAYWQTKTQQRLARVAAMVQAQAGLPMAGY